MPPITNNFKFACANIILVRIDQGRLFIASRKQSQHTAILYQGNKISETAGSELPSFGHQIGPINLRPEPMRIVCPITQRNEMNTRNNLLHSAAP
jgi:hypothetical protein